MCNQIMAVKINKRSTAAPVVQEVLTRHGSIIHVRLGVHEIQGGHSNDGLVLLQLNGEDSQIKNLQDELAQLDLVQVKTMSLD